MRSARSMICESALRSGRSPRKRQPPQRSRAVPQLKREHGLLRKRKADPDLAADRHGPGIAQHGFVAPLRYRLDGGIFENTGIAGGARAHVLELAGLRHGELDIHPTLDLAVYRLRGITRLHAFQQRELTGGDTPRL